MARQAGRAAATYRRDPLDADAVAHLDARRLGSRSHLDDLAHAFVAAYLSCLGGSGQAGPAVRHDAQVAVADARVRQVDQDFARAGLGHVEVYDLGGDFARLIVDDGLVSLGEVAGRTHFEQRMEDEVIREIWSLVSLRC